MASMVKRGFVIVNAASIFLLSACTVKYNRDIEDDANAWMGYIQSKNQGKLMDCFCDDIRKKHTDEITKNIDNLMDFVDGKITSYNYRGEGYCRQSQNNHVTNLYYCCPEFLVETSTGKKYFISFNYIYIWQDHTECVGLTGIRAINYKDENNIYDGEEVKFEIEYSFESIGK